MKYRNRMEISAAILTIALEGGGARKTKIMYDAYLSFPQLKDYLGYLQEAGLLEYDEATKEFTITEKGKGFLKNYKQLSAALPVVHK